MTRESVSGARIDEVVDISRWLELVLSQEHEEREAKRPRGSGGFNGVSSRGQSHHSRGRLYKPAQMARPAHRGALASHRSSEGSGSSRVQEFIALSPPEFTETYQREDPQDFIDQLHRIFRVMHATEKEAVELAAFRLRDIATLWYEGWERSKARDAPPASWENFSDAFLD
ncbi:uncharacterized protein [Nicotiana tomentosiformis]|uniref:uncharacterized protein n=1 Tax=Nicotiana tomentosiformis TaxID=4098 RepID=UPI00388C3417